MKAQSRVEVWLYSSFNIVPRWVWVVKATPRSLYPPGKTRYPLYRRLGAPQGWCGCVRKISPPPGLGPRTVQPFNPYPTAFPYGNGMVLQFYQQQESSTTKTVHKVINKGLKTYV